jgi:hypothetical protein
VCLHACVVTVRSAWVTEQIAPWDVCVVRACDCGCLLCLLQEFLFSVAVCPSVTLIKPFILLHSAQVPQPEEVP